MCHSPADTELRVLVPTPVLAEVPLKGFGGTNAAGHGTGLMLGFQGRPGCSLDQPTQREGLLELLMPC